MKTEHKIKTKHTMKKLFTLLFAISFIASQAQWTTTGNDIYNSNSANVGIGTTAPSAKLQVVSTSTAIPVFQVKGNNGASLFNIRNDGYIDAGNSWRTSGSITIGSNSGFDSTLLHNTCYGYQTLGSNGEQSPYSRSLTTGNRNTLIGALVGFHITSGYRNTMVGDESGEFTESGYFNTGVGYQTLVGNKTSYNNTAIGASALSGEYRISGGIYVACNTFPVNSTVVGAYAWSADSSSVTNSAFGFQSLQLNHGGHDNATFGSNTLGRQVSGYNNTAMGENAGALVKGTPIGNTLIGALAGYGDNTNAFSHNTIIGTSAGQSLTTGSDNIIIGYQANANIWGNLNSTLWIDAGNNSIPTLYGNLSTKQIGIGVTSTSEKLTVAGRIRSTNSDIVVESSSKGLILKDTQSTPHYWRITISNAGVLTTTDVGTSLPAE